MKAEGIPSRDRLARHVAVYIVLKTYVARLGHRVGLVAVVIAVASHIRLAGDVADGVIFVGLAVKGYRTVQTGHGGEAIEVVVKIGVGDI